MYTPSAFRVEDPQAAFGLIDRFGFATLITVKEGRSVVSHLPMIADAERRVLRGHLARANPHSALIDGARHLAVFIGENAYVSPDWYEDATDVPTWNYSAAHVEGAARVFSDPEDVDALLNELSDRHEGRRHDLAEGRFWKLSKLPAEKLRRLRTAIVAFEIAADRIELKAKLSQNRNAADFARVIAKLERGDAMERAVANAMRDRGGAR
jgi:transcriptional regulator